jgi:succinoglycan biosynthesis transport protein ExoP
MSDSSEQHPILLPSLGNGHRRDLAAAGGYPLSVPLDAGLNGASHESAGGNELRKLKQMMRGRWGLAISLALAGAALGGAAGFRAGHKIYASNAEIRIAAVVPKVLYAVDSKDIPPMFDSFVESQVSLLKSPRVMNEAMLDPVWKPTGRGPGDAAAAALASSIEVTREGELISVKATDLDPDIAAASTRSVVAAFQKIYDEGDAASNERVLLALQKVQDQKGAELAAIREEISNIARPYGTDELRGLFQMKQKTVEDLETQIEQAKSDLTASARNRAGSRLSDRITPEQWAAISSEMSSLVADRDSAQRRLDLLHARGMDNSPEVATEKTVVETDEREMETLSSRLQAQRAVGLLALPTPGGSGTSRFPVDPDQLQEQITELEARHTTAQDQMIAVGKDQLKIADFKYKADQVIRDRDAAQQQIDRLNTEATINGRVTVINPGDRPLGPYRDTRIIFAAAGGFGGALLAFAAVAGFAALDRRLRNPDETETTVGPVSLLGLLPRLPDDLANGVQAARAAHCVTGVRNMLQLWGRAGRRKVFVVTSPVPGAGKTSLTFALGVSYATARSNTLIIDCDLVGGGLTARAEKVVTRKLGQLFLREGLLSEEQLAEALLASKDQSRRLGETVVDRGWVSPADVDRLLVRQHQESIGILDALDGTPLDQCVTATGIHGLSLLPVGSATSRDVQLLSAEPLKRLADAARQLYDVVLIDTGPIPGSLEAQLAASVADGVIVVVTPGVKRPLVRKCIDRLSDIGASVAGLVYNRASENEVFVYSSGSQPRIENELAEEPTVPDNRPAEKLGPLASAVSRAAPGDKVKRSGS